MTNYIGNCLFALMDQGEMASILVLKPVVKPFWNVQPECLKNILKGRPGLLRLHHSTCCQWYSCNICEVWTVDCGLCMQTPSWSRSVPWERVCRF